MIFGRRRQTPRPIANENGTTNTPNENDALGNKGKDAGVARSVPERTTRAARQLIDTVRRVIDASEYKVVESTKMSEKTSRDTSEEKRKKEEERELRERN